MKHIRNGENMTFYSADICDRIKEDKKRCEKIIRMKAYKEKDDHELF